MLNRKASKLALAICVLAFMLLGFSAWFVLYQPRMSPAEVARLLQQNHGIVADRAKILRGSPDGHGLFGGNNTLLVVNPRLVRSSAELPARCCLVLPQQKGVAETVMLAKGQLAEFGPNNLYVMLPAEVMIVRVGDAGRFRVEDRHDVNYIQAR